jgi:spore germination protein GerM
MSRWRILVLLSLALALTIVFVSYAGGEAASSAGRSAKAAAQTTRTTVYFLSDDAAAPLGVRREINRDSPYAREALDELLDGPTAAERRRGITTAIPAEAHLVSLTLKRRERVVAFVNLAGLPPAEGRQGEQATLGMRVRVITQVARTLIGLSGITSVEIKVDGKPWDLWTMNGGIARMETNYERLRGWTLICGVRSSAERKLGLNRCFSALP